MASEATRRRKLQGRSTAKFVGIPDYVFRSSEFGELDGWALKLLVEIAGGFNGYNNGDLSCAWSALKARGWRSTGTLWKALRSLQQGGWITTTRHGTRGRCALYALSWHAIDECPGKLLEVKATRTPSNCWQKNKNAARYVKSTARYAESNGGELA